MDDRLNFKNGRRNRSGGGGGVGGGGNERSDGLENDVAGDENADDADRPPMDSPASAYANGDGGGGGATADGEEAAGGDVAGDGRRRRLAPTPPTPPPPQQPDMMTMGISEIKRELRLYGIATDDANMDRRGWEGMLSRERRMRAGGGGGGGGGGVGGGGGAGRGGGKTTSSSSRRWCRGSATSSPTTGEQDR
jgi:hypothetical protein